MKDGARSERVTLAVVVLTLVVGTFGAALYTEPDQLLDTPSAWLFAVYPHLGWISTAVAVAALFVLYRHLRHGIGRRRLLTTGQDFRAQERSTPDETGQPRGTWSPHSCAREWAVRNLDIWSTHANQLRRSRRHRAGLSDPGPGA